MRKCNLKWNTWKTGTSSDIHDFVYFVHFHSLHTGEAVQKVLYQHLLKFCDSGQVHDFVFFNQIFIKCNKLLFLHFIQGNAEFFTPFIKYFQIISQYSYPLFLRNFFCTVRDIPEVRKYLPVIHRKYEMPVQWRSDGIVPVSVSLRYVNFLLFRNQDLPEFSLLPVS